MPAALLDRRSRSEPSRSWGSLLIGEKCAIVLHVVQHVTEVHKVEHEQLLPSLCMEVHYVDSRKKKDCVAPNLVSWVRASVRLHPGVSGLNVTRSVVVAK